MEPNMLAGYAVMAATAGRSAWPGKAVTDRGLAPVGWAGRPPVPRTQPAPGPDGLFGLGFTGFAGMLLRADEPSQESGVVLAAP